MFGSKTQNDKSLNMYEFTFWIAGSAKRQTQHVLASNIMEAIDKVTLDKSDIYELTITKTAEDIIK